MTSKFNIYAVMGFNHLHVFEQLQAILLPLTAQCEASKRLHVQGYITLSHHTQHSLEREKDVYQKYNNQHDNHTANSFHRDYFFNRKVAVI